MNNACCADDYVGGYVCNCACTGGYIGQNCTIGKQEHYYLREFQYLLLFLNFIKRCLAICLNPAKTWAHARTITMAATRARV
jgi:hypothetical protein